MKLGLYFTHGDRFRQSFDPDEVIRTFPEEVFMQTEILLYYPLHSVAHNCNPRFFTYSDGEPSAPAPVVCCEEDKMGRL